VAETLARSGELDRAESLAREIAEAAAKVQLMTLLAEKAAEAEDLDHARALVATAESLLDAITDADTRTRAVDRAEHTAREIPDDDRRAWTTARLAVIAADELADLDRARDLADAAERLALDIPDTYSRFVTAMTLIGVAERTEDPDRAERLARAIHHGSHSEALARLVRVVARADGLSRAEHLARSIADRWARTRVVARLVGEAALGGDFYRAERMARDIDDDHERRWALAWRRWPPGACSRRP
jgi:hypothetical protein